MGSRYTRACAAVAVIVLSATAAFIARPPGYIGTTRRVMLTWDCFNGIAWPHERTKHDYWWAGGQPVAHGEILTPLPKGGVPGLQNYVATGTLHFDSRAKAIFTSDAGGKLPMVRESWKSAHNASCSLGMRVV